MADLTQKIESLTEEMDKTNAPMQELISKSRAYHDQRLFLQASSHEPAVEIRDNVKSGMMQALENLRVGILDPQKNDHWHAQLLLLLDKIILHPIARSQKGETVEVVTREHAWPEFYRMMQFNTA
ncbi:MAG: hypothetical protein HRT36_00055 [Alphaproteobacteria bacterium]|nr:hypothetical protein [Alphaproteobacteria bacterium]